MKPIPNVPGVGCDRSVLSTILRAAVFADRDRSSPVLSGVCLEPHANALRAVATDGKGLAALHCPWSGPSLAEPVIICRDGLARIAAAYRAARRHLERMSWVDRCETGAPAPSDAPIAVSLGKGHHGRTVLRFELPQLDESFAVGLVEGRFPQYEMVAERRAYRIGFKPGVGFDVDYLANAQRVLRQPVLIPHHGGRAVFFRGEGGDYVLVMPIALPDTDKDVWLFGKPEAQS